MNCFLRMGQLLAMQSLKNFYKLLKKKKEPLLFIVRLDSVEQVAW